MTTEGIREAAFIAKNKFHDRRISELSIELEDWIDDDRKKVAKIDLEGKKLAVKDKEAQKSDKEKNEKKENTNIDTEITSNVRNVFIATQKNRMSIEIMSNLISTTRALSYIKDKDENIVNSGFDEVYKQSINELGEKFDMNMKNLELNKQQNTIENIKVKNNQGIKRGGFLRFWDNLNIKFGKLFDVVPIGSLKGWVKHSQGVFSTPDRMAEIFIAGKGPFGFLGFAGLW
eukprot:CAMPEP_0119038070 /NCGR_PEP_ID=MMETSP1177-20130426/6756_1 /TAXON_ID=2985 /ORGANISM="Ochromonas sp, Strain CCMP1899" /LENGTH=230 /DNA_ID=CAMNT_0007000157 /DNA_START=462 /DNA_END=1151 /DNA_ORIENTATION=+